MTPLQTARRFFTTFEASHFLGVSLPTVVNWIKANRLKAHRTPGGHRRIARDELASFIRRHGMPMPPELAEEGESARLLVVDDSEPRLAQLLSGLERAGYDCMGASTGFAAGLAVGVFKPDLILLDASTSGVDAASLVAALKAHPHTSRLPVVGLSGSRDEKAHKRATAAGLRDLIPKPVDYEVLKRKVEQVLRSRRAA